MHFSVLCLPGLNDLTQYHNQTQASQTWGGKNAYPHLQDKVYNVVQKLAVQRGYDFILDKSEGITVIFADPKLEKSEDVLRELGVK